MFRHPTASRALAFQVSHTAATQQSRIYTGQGLNTEGDRIVHNTRTDHRARTREAYFTHEITIRRAHGDVGKPLRVALIIIPGPGHSGRREGDIRSVHAARGSSHAARDLGAHGSLCLQVRQV